MKTILIIIFLLKTIIINANLFDVNFLQLKNNCLRNCIKNNKTLILLKQISNFNKELNKEINEYKNYFMFKVNQLYFDYNSLSEEDKFLIENIINILY
jgi:hypothetical protein